MQVNWFRIGKQRRLVPIKQLFTQDNLQEYADPVWVDVETVNENALEELLTQLEPNQLVLEAMLESPAGTRLLPFDDELYAQFSVPATEQTTRLEYISVLVRPDMVLTVHTAPLNEMNRFAASYADLMSLHAPGTAPLLYHLLDYFLDILIGSMLTVRDHINHFAEELDDAERDLEPGDIIAVKRWLSRLAVTGEDILYCVSVLQSADPEAFRFDNNRMMLRDLFSQAEYVLRRINRFETRLQDLSIQMQGALQSRTESRLRVLTVISAIFQPLTLIAGIYGMNFLLMPELQWRYGYFTVLGVMVLVGVSLLVYFKRKGWFED